MKGDFDVVVVGARCAGSPLAALLARAGLKVCVVDRARFPSEVPSTHMLHPAGVAILERLGVLDKMLATGAPPLERGSFQFDDIRIEGGPEVLGGFGAPWLCVRRVTLDSLLVGMAEESGAQVLTQTKVVGLIADSGVVRGVRTEAGSLKAALVVGADGPRSAVARFTGAREYHVTHPGRFASWAYFEGVAEPHARARLGKVGDTGFLAMPTDDGLFMAGVGLSMSMLPAYMADTDRGLTEGLRQIDELSGVLGSARRVGPIRVMSRWRGYFREAAGPGWALVGDAGHFKDFTPAQGMSDALRQAERLAPSIEAGLGRGHLADRLDAWWKWRDDDAWEMYWFANQIGASGPNPRMANEMIRGLSQEPGGAEKFLRVLNHDVAPSTVFSNRRGLRTLIQAGRAHPRRLPRLVSETGSLMREEARQRRLRRRPIFETSPADPSDQAATDGTGRSMHGTPPGDRRAELG
jgi:2-polyprenyl-6-methoxyphenol hydroxylase-like FAD-dependent oxidoreductase